MAFSPKSKVLELSSIPWPTNQIKQKKSKIPWAKPLKKQKASFTPFREIKRAQLLKGKEAEIKTMNWLETQGLALVTQNYRCRCGEIDLIMAQGQTAIVVEVRLRNNMQHGNALDSITPQKQRRVSHCALQWWVQQGQRKFRFLRFDVVALQDECTPVWIQNAWQINRQ